MEKIRAGVPTLRFTVCVDQELSGFDSLAALARAGSEAPINVHLAPDAVGFQGSTGGTTGAPKVTQGGQAFLTWNAIGFMTEFHFDRPPVNLAVAPITHAGGIVAMATLALSGTVVFMATADSAAAGRDAAHRVSLLFPPPTLIYADQPPAHPRDRPVVAGNRSGGGPVRRREDRRTPSSGR